MLHLLFLRASMRQPLVIVVEDLHYISEETVKTHVSNILSKLAARDRTHAMTIALKRGIIEI